jgi:glycerophosphoryl diester phosphodiesterase
MGRKLKISGTLIAGAAAGLWIGNTNLLAPEPEQKTELLAHRGVHQTFSSEGLTGETCTAARINPPTHTFVENTIASMQAAFDAGADRVEFDVHPTTDGKFAVFHDWTLDCRTDGKGVTREKSLPELKALDIGFGYTADHGATYPLRGKGIGLLPSLDEVLATFPGRKFLVHVKSRDAQEGRKLAQRLSQLTAEERGALIVYGADEPLNEIKAALRDQRIASRGNLMNCLARYMALGWSGHVPDACRDGVMFVPSNIAPFLWGWPNRLAARLADADATLVVLGPYSGGDFSTGIDSAEALEKLPKNLPALIWTNRIEEIAPLMKREP